MKFELFIFIFFLFLSQINCLYLSIEGNRDYCFQTQAKEGSNLTISYVVSGFNEGLVTMTV